jgi:hypothetical protein
MSSWLSCLKDKMCIFFGWMAFVSWAVLFGCIYFLPYVGVYVVYICIPIGLLSTVFWWKLNRDLK